MDTWKAAPKAVHLVVPSAQLSAVLMAFQMVENLACLLSVLKGGKLAAWMAGYSVENSVGH